MTDLIFHIGFPKCASTTLQNEIFKNECGYLGTYKGLLRSKNYSRQFQAISPVGPRLWGNLNQAGKWAEKVAHIGGTDLVDYSRLIASSEMFTNRNWLNDRPIIGFLKKFNKKVWAYGQVKVLLILRNPAERLASEYAQVSISNPHASQANFVQHVASQLNSKNKIDYDHWVTELYQALGEENVCVLLMEEIGRLGFWEQLMDFCRLENFNPQHWLTGSSAKNSRNKDKFIWQLRPYDPAEKAKTISNNIFGLLWPVYFFSGFRPQGHQMFKNKVTQYYKKRYGHMEDRERGLIQLTPDLRKQVQAAYEQQTNTLSELLQKDLKKLGY